MMINFTILNIYNIIYSIDEIEDLKWQTRVKCTNHSPSKVLRRCHFLSFAYEIKLFMQIHSKDDCYILQNEIDSFVTFFKSLGLSLN